MTTARTATVAWKGDLKSGQGQVSAASGAFRELPVSWPSRLRATGDSTSPEELIAAAHASCFAMALAAGLGRGGTPPSWLEVRATVALEEGVGAYRIRSSDLVVRGAVAGLDAEGFQTAVEAAKEGCPVSQALRSAIAITAKATLEEGAG